MTTNEHNGVERMSGFAESENPAPIHEFSRPDPGQSYPQHYPQVKDALGEPLSIIEVARLLGLGRSTVFKRRNAARAALEPIFERLRREQPPVRLIKTKKE